MIAQTSHTPPPVSTPLPARCHAASRQIVAASIGIDLAVVLVPLSIGLWVSAPALLRLLLVLAAFGLFLTQIVAHCLYGRAVGGLILGLLTVDVDAGLPTGTARSLLPLACLGSAAGAIVLNIRQGPDPSRMTLDELDVLSLTTRAQAASETSPYSQAAPKKASSAQLFPSEPPRALHAVSAQTPPTSFQPLPPSVPPQAPPPPPPPEAEQYPSTATLPQVPTPPRMTRKALRAQERAQERMHAQQEASLTDARARGSERMVG